jgi:hypothetical protein
VDATDNLNEAANAVYRALGLAESGSVKIATSSAATVTDARQSPRRVLAVM